MKKKKVPKTRSAIAYHATKKTGAGAHRDRKREQKQKGFEDAEDP